MLFFQAISILLLLVVARNASAGDALPLTLAIPQPVRSPRMTVREETEAPHYYSCSRPSFERRSPQ